MAAHWAVVGDRSHGNKTQFGRGAGRQGGERISEGVWGGGGGAERMSIGPREQACWLCGNWSDATESSSFVCMSLICLCAAPHRAAQNIPPRGNPSCSTDLVLHWEKTMAHKTIENMQVCEIEWTWELGGLGAHPGKNGGRWNGVGGKEFRKELIKDYVFLPVCDIHEPKYLKSPCTWTSGVRCATKRKIISKNCECNHFAKKFVRKLRNLPRDIFLFKILKLRVDCLCVFYGIFFLWKFQKFHETWNFILYTLMFIFPW